MTPATPHTVPDGLPVALPVASPNPAPFPPVTAIPGDSAARKDVPPDNGGTPLSVTRRGPGEPGLRRLINTISPRDLDVLRSVGSHRFLTTHHIQRLHFHTHHTPASAARTCRRVIRLLADKGLISALPRRVGGFAAGSASGIWHLTGTGTRLLRLVGGSPRSRSREPSQRLVKHCLAIADAHLALLEAARAGAFAVTPVQLEPDSWRRYLGPLGQPDILKPDLYVVTRSPDGQYEDHWFIEVDLGTEHPPTVVCQCQQYQAYRTTGAEQANGGVFPLVVWSTRADRLTRLQDALQEARSLDHELFRVVAHGQLAGLVAVVSGGSA